jgi:hypothetical protein
MTRRGFRFIWMQCAMSVGWLAVASTSFAQQAGCGDGFVQREAFAGDTVCVTPEARKGASEQNENGRGYRKNGEECLPGFVWRMAGPQDHVCVSQAERDIAQQDNHLDAERRSPRTGPPLPELRIPGAGENVRTPPTQPGCHRYENGAWHETACLSEDFVRRHFPPPTAQNSIKSIPKLFLTPNLKRALVYTVPVVFGSVDLMHLSDPALGTVTDSLVGSDAFSIQVNTNFFAASNGNVGWVQFVLQSNSSLDSDALCVWNVDVTVAVATKNASGYSPLCVAIPKERTVFTADRQEGRRTTFIGPGAEISERSRVAGYLSKSARGLPTLGAWAYVPWSPFSAYAVSAPDTYGLTGRWTEVSGDIIGLGNGSRANFAHTKIRTVIQASSCVDGSINPCPSAVSPLFNLSTSAAASVDNVTGEDSNLSSNYDFSYHPPSLSCFKGSCWLDYSAGPFSFLKIPRLPFP